MVATSVAAEGNAEASNGPGFAVVTDDPVVMGTTLVHILSDPARAREIGDAGREWVRATYDFDRSMAAVVATYERLIGRA